MGVSREQAAENRRAIIAAAGKLFRERGVDAVGLAELMKHAGFTQGGFYNHFASKEDLVAEVIAAAVQAAGQQLAAEKARPNRSTTAALRRYVEYYLSEAHRDDVGGGCPVAGFAGDAPHTGDTAQSSYAEGVEGLVGWIEALIVASEGGKDGEEPSGKDGGKASRERAMRLYCEMVGSLVLSRAVERTSPKLAAELLATSRRGLAVAAEPAVKPRRGR